MAKPRTMNRRYRTKVKFGDLLSLDYAENASEAIVQAFGYMNGTDNQAWAEGKAITALNAMTVTMGHGSPGKSMIRATAMRMGQFDDMISDLRLNPKPERKSHPARRRSEWQRQLHVYRFSYQG